MCLQKKTHVYVFINAIFFQTAVFINFSNAQISMNGWDLLLQMINSTLVTKADI